MVNNYLTMLTKDRKLETARQKGKVIICEIAKQFAGSRLITRSQARRVLSGLEKFKIIVFDFDKVPVVGQAFADEIFRVFHKRYPEIKLEPINMNEAARFMVERAINEAKGKR